MIRCSHTDVGFRIGWTGITEESFYRIGLLSTNRWDPGVFSKPLLLISNRQQARLDDYVAGQ